MNIVKKVRQSIQELNVDGLLITSSNNRRYVSRFTGSAGVLLITENDAILITDFRYVEQAKKQAPAFTIIKHEAQLYDEVKNQIKRLNIQRLAIEAAHMTVTEFRKLETDLAATLLPSENVVEKLRHIKTEEEIELIKVAAQIVDEAFEHILQFIKPGVAELDIATELEYVMRKKGATSSSFDTIVASGVRSSLPHGVASEKKIAEGELVTLDFGAIYKGYCSDITRTVAVGNVRAELREIYNIVLEAQKRGVKEIKAGMKASSADALTRDYITEKGYGAYFGHSTGHGIGLEVHEGPALSPRSDEILVENMVVTVEPGIYLPNVGGCRIEDDIVITENGNQRLTLSTKEFIQL